MKKLAFFVAALFVAAVSAQEPPTPYNEAVQAPPAAAPVAPNDGAVQVLPQAPPNAAVQEALNAAAQKPQGLPRIAVYVTGDIGEGEKKALGTRMLASLVNSGRYRGIERSDAFLAEIEREHIRQRSGDIDDSQISELGKQFGVKFVCIADITPAFGAYLVSARIVNVETAEVPFIGDASSPFKTMDDLEQVSVDIVRKMLYFGESGGGAKQAQPTVVVIQQGKEQKEKPLRTTDFTAGERMGTWSMNVIPGLGSYVIMDDKKGAVTNAIIGGGGLALFIIGVAMYEPVIFVPGLISWLGGGSAWNIYRSIAYHNPNANYQKKPKPKSYGAGGFYAHNVGGGLHFEGGGEIAMPYDAGGGYLYLDLVYIEFAAGFAGGGGKWKSYDTNYPQYLPDMERTYINFETFLKWPFGWERVKIFPLLGAGYEFSISAELKNGLPGIPQPDGLFDLNVLWYKVGGGIDVSLRQNIYLRAEALYGLRFSNDYEYYDYDGGYNNYYDYAYGRMGDGLTVKIAAGINFGKGRAGAENGKKLKHTDTAANGQKEEK